MEKTKVITTSDAQTLGADLPIEGLERCEGNLQVRLPRCFVWQGG